MRPIPKDKLEKLVQASCSTAGQPIHIGDPGQCALSFMILTAAFGLRPKKKGACYVPDLPQPY